MKKILPLVIICFGTTVQAEPEIKGTPAELAGYLSTLPKLVSIVGEAEVKASADRAILTLKISTESRLLQESLKLNQEARGRVIAHLKDNGFATNQWQAARFSSTQKHGVFSEKAKSHRVDNFLRITVRDEKDFQAVANAVDRWPEVHFLGIESGHTDKEALKARALAQACDRANERRKLLEEKLGAKLSPKRFSEAVVTPVQSDRRYYGVGYASASKVDGRHEFPARAGGEFPQDESASPFGELAFTARITVEYAVESW